MIYAQKGISILALIITIILTIILSATIINNVLNISDDANKTRFIADLAEIQYDVGIKRAHNLIPQNEESYIDINEGFTKIKIKKSPKAELEDGWVVNLNEINIYNSTLGNEYKDIDMNSEISFGPSAPDIYVYDALGIVYYARGYTDKYVITYGIDYITCVNEEDWDFDLSTGTIFGYSGPNVNELIVPSYIYGIRVTNIKGDINNEQGILYNKNISNLIISNGIKIINEFAFANCKSIDNITISGSVETIEKNAFSGCTDLRTISISNGLKKISDYAFSYCTDLYSIVIPNSTIEIGNYAFIGCTRLENVTIPSATVDIRTGTFSGCRALKEVTISAGVKNILDYAFYNCTDLFNINIPYSVEYISSTAFNGCKGLKKIIINKAKNSIGGAPWGATNAVIVWTPI
jgi:type II secretory pathway pseudopilin PulG